jgi:hypothetical protein
LSRNRDRPTCLLTHRAALVPMLQVLNVYLVTNRCKSS